MLELAIDAIRTACVEPNHRGLSREKDGCSGGVRIALGVNGTPLTALIIIFGRRACVERGWLRPTTGIDYSFFSLT